MQSDGDGPGPKIQEIGFLKDPAPVGSQWLRMFFRVARVPRNLGNPLGLRGHLLGAPNSAALNFKIAGRRARELDTKNMGMAPWQLTLRYIVRALPC